MKYINIYQNVLYFTFFHSGFVQGRYLSCLYFTIYITFSSIILLYFNRKYVSTFIFYQGVLAMTGSRVMNRAAEIWMTFSMEIKNIKNVKNKNKKRYSISEQCVSLRMRVRVRAIPFLWHFYDVIVTSYYIYIIFTDIDKFITLSLTKKKQRAKCVNAKPLYTLSQRTRWFS